MVGVDQSTLKPNNKTSHRSTASSCTTLVVRKGMRMSKRGSSSRGQRSYEGWPPNERDQSEMWGGSI